jgi:Fe-S oxidoreductase
MLAKKEAAEALYFVDSITSYDDRMQEIGRATATVLSRAGADFGILGKMEKDSGNEIRRFGEEMLVSDHQGDQYRCHPKQRRQAHHHRRSPCLQCPEK